MELEEFISKTLISITKGIRKANIEIAESEGKTLGVDAESAFVMEPHNRDKGQGYVTFDIAVTVAQENKGSVGGGIKIAIASLGSEIAERGAEENVSRIKFHIIPHHYIT